MLEYLGETYYLFEIPMTIPWPLLAAVSIPLLYLAVVDWREYRLPNRVLLPLVPLVLGAAVLSRAGKQSLLGGSIGLGLILIPLLIVGPENLGVGDVKLMLLLGLISGWPGILFVTLLGTILAGMYASWGFLRRDFSWQTRLPLGPFFIGGLFLTAMLSYLFS